MRSHRSHGHGARRRSSPRPTRPQAGEIRLAIRGDRAGRGGEPFEQPYGRRSHVWRAERKDFVTDAGYSGIQPRAIATASGTDYGDCGSLAAPRLVTGREGGGTTGPISPSGASSRSTITGA